MVYHLRSRLTERYFSVDVDECQAKNHNCHVKAQCDNSEGSFNCTCLQGYSGDGVNCTGMIYPS